MRKVCLFSVAESARGRMLRDVLAKEDMTEMGRLMFISHDGGRVATFNTDGSMHPHESEASDAYMDELLGKTSDTRGTLAVLPYVPGGYPNSCPQTDRIVDLCKAVEGVYGACLTGAGFGGHVVAIVARGHTGRLLDALRQQVYEPGALRFSAYRCLPIAGATVHEIIT